MTRWAGSHRDEYAGERPLVAQDAVAARGALNRLAGAIASAMTAAAAEQFRRVADRARWRAETERERNEPRFVRLPNGKPVPI